MKLPNYERQNKFIKDYVLPLLQGNLKGIAHTYKRNQREALRNDMQEAGVFESLKRMDTRGTLEEHVFDEMRSNISKAAKEREYQKMADEVYTLLQKDPRYVGMAQILLGPQMAVTLDVLGKTHEASETYEGVTNALIRKDPLWYYQTFLKQENPMNCLVSGIELINQKI